MARKISVEIVGDSRSLERAFARSSKSAERFHRQTSSTFKGTIGASRALQGALASVGVGIGLGVVVSQLKDTVQQASNLNEQINRTRVVFGRATPAVVEWSKTTAEAIGLAQQEALEGAANFGTMFRTIGVAAPRAAQMSKVMTTLAGDMASFNNQDPSDMLLRLRSGLAGEAEPLRRFGVLLSEARVKQEAYRLGLAKTGDELTEQQKVAARYSLILRDTALQQGDYARTADSLANVQRTVTAQIADLSTQIGARLLPYVRQWLIELRNWLSDSENQKRVIGTVTTAVRVLADAVRKMIEAWRKIRRIIDFLAEVAQQIRIFRKQIRIEAIRAVLAFVEPFSHLPRRFGGWAQDIKRRFHDSLVAETADLRDLGAEGGKAYGTGLQMGLRGVTGPGGRKVRKQVQQAVPPPAAIVSPRRRPAGITAAQRNQWFDARIARQLDRLQDLSLRKQLARLKEIAAAVRLRLAATRDITRRLNLEDKLLDILRQQRSVQGEIAEQIKAANEALKERADAIKSAVLERLQRRQTAILNQRALADAREQLRIARQIGGPAGIKQAMRALQDVRFDILRARVEAAPARLTAGGRFALGGMVTINITGVTDPEEVARRVTAILQRRRRRTTTQTRGPAAGMAA